MNSCIKILLVLSILLNLPNIKAVEDLDLPYAQFTRISTDSGLSQKTVQQIYQDSNGFVWLGTQEGLNLYDGTKFTTFRHEQNNKKSISHDVIKGIAEDHQNKIWIATRGGLNLLEADFRHFSKIDLKTSNGETIYRLNLVQPAPNNNLWVGTDGKGIQLVDPIKKKQFETPDSLKIFEGMDITSIHFDSRRRVWVGTDGNGLFMQKQGEPRWSHFKKDNTKSSLSGNRVRSIVENSKGKIWIATKGDGISEFNELTGSFKQFKANKNNPRALKNDRVYQLMFDKEDNLWIATDGGISVYLPKRNKFISINASTTRLRALSNDRCLSLMQDESGLVWIGTIAGINIWDPKTGEIINYRKSNNISGSLNYDTITAFSSYKDKILISTYGDGISLFDPEKRSFRQVASLSQSNLMDNRVMTLYTDDKNNTWVGTRSNGVAILDSNFKVIREFKSRKDSVESLSANGITDIIRDRDDEFWVSTYRAGLNRWLGQGNGFRHYRTNSMNKKENKEGLNSEKIYQLLEDEDGYIWLATDGGGISRLDKIKDEIISIVHQPEIADSLSGDIIMSMFEDSKGRFWIGTQGNGLNRWEAEDRRKLHQNFKHYSHQQGLESSSINGILEDDDGFIWISTNRGVSKLDPATDQFQHFNLTDQADGNELNQGALIKAKDGRLYFGGISGVSAFQPDKLSINTHKPKVIVREVLAKNQPLQLPNAPHQTHELTFAHDDYLISLSLAALDYADPSKNQYQYKLEGFDDEWIQLGTLNRITFTNLPSGNYRLKIMGSNNDGVWSDPVDAMQINILPAWWQSWWALAIYAALFVFFMLALIRNQAKRLVKQELIQQQIDKQVSTKTKLIANSQQQLIQQLERAQQNAIVDVDSGLPARSFSAEILRQLLSWQRDLHASNSSKDDTFTIYLALLTSNRSDNEHSVNSLKQLALLLTGATTDNQYVGHWQKQQILLIGHQQPDFKRLFAEATPGPDSIIEIRLPLANRAASIKWDQLMLILEHLSQLLKQSSHKHYRISGLKIKLTGQTISQILSCQTLQTVEQYLDISPVEA